jgi:hypothetical protein
LEVETQLYSFLSLELDWMGGKRHAPPALFSGKSPGTYFTSLKCAQIGNTVKRLKCKETQTYIEVEMVVI